MKPANECAPRALMIAPAFAPAFFSEALVNSKLALAMLDAGWDLTVYAAPSGDDVYASDWNAPWSRLKAVRREVLPPPRAASLSARASHAAHRLLCALRTRHPIASAGWAERTADAALSEHSVKPFDLVLSRSTSCVAHLPALLFRRALGDDAPVWIANWNDPPGHRFPPPYQYPLPRLQRFFTDRYLRAAATLADVNAFPSSRLRDYLAGPLDLNQKDVPAGRSGIVVSHIGFGYRPKPEASRDPMRFRLAHAGNLSAERDPTPLFRAMAKLAERYPELHIEFEIIGRLERAFEKAAESLGVAHRVRRVPGMPFLDCLDRLSTADLQVLIEAPCEQGIFMPSKLIDYIEVGKPILALSPRVGVVRDLLEHHGFGLFAANDDEDDVEMALSRAIDEHLNGGVTHVRTRMLADMADRVRPERIVNEIRQAASKASAERCRLT